MRLSLINYTAQITPLLKEKIIFKSFMQNLFVTDLFCVSSEFYGNCLLYFGQSRQRKHLL